MPDTFQNHLGEPLLGEYIFVSWGVVGEGFNITLPFRGFIVICNIEELSSWVPTHVYAHFRQIFLR